MNVNLTPNITGKNVNIIKGATQADLTNSVNNSKIYRDEAEAFSIVSEAKSVEASYSALNASISSTTASDKAAIATTKANEANNSAINASASEAVCIAKATIATDNADIAIAQAVIATNKATEANTSANTANTQANIAITKASEASISAINALTSENNADTSEANALIYRNQAESFANSINPSDLVHISGTETITGNKTFSGTVSGLTKATVGLGNVNNTSDANKPISNAVQTALGLKAYKATTLGGYGINDAYTKTSTDSLVDIHSKTAKTTLVDADEFMTADSTSTFSLKKITWASIKTVLASLFTPRVAITTNKAIARYSNTTGDLQNSAITIDDSGNIGSGTQSFNGFGGSGFKNVIINGKFNVNQYGRLPYVAQAGSVCYIDCWRAANSGTGTLTLSEDSITYSGKVFKAMKATATTAITLGSNTRYYAFSTNLEANNVLSISTDNMTLSFLFECSRAGKYSVSLVKDTYVGGPKSYTTSFTATVGVQQVIISIPTDSYQVLDGINIGLILHVGFVGNLPSIITSVDGWQSLGTSTWMKSDALSWGDTVGAYIKIADVNLEPGLSKSPSENRPYGLELSLCQRYYQTNLRSGYTYTLSGTTNAWRTTIPLLQPMRMAPTSFGFNGAIIFQGNAGGNTLGTIGTTYNQINCIQFDGSFTANNGSNTGTEPMVANGGYFWASAEL